MAPKQAPSGRTAADNVASLGRECVALTVVCDECGRIIGEGDWDGRTLQVPAPCEHGLTE